MLPRLDRQHAGNMKSYRDGMYFHGKYLWHMAIKWPFALAVLISVLSQGCALFTPSPEGQGSIPASVCRTGNIRKDLQAVAASITSITARVRVQLTVYGQRASQEDIQRYLQKYPQKYPWIDCILHYSPSPSGVRMRVTGLGPFGITVFDTLVRDRQFFLYIPTDKAVYFANIGPQGQVNSPHSLDQQLRYVLNPWSLINNNKIRQTICPRERDRQMAHNHYVCLSSSTGHWSIPAAMFTYDTLGPISIETKDLSARFAGRITHGNIGLPSCVPYPDTITATLKDFNLKIDIKIKEIEFNNTPHNLPIFDSLPFTRMRMVPLEVLTSRSLHVIPY